MTQHPIACLYCGEQFIPKSKRGTCCSRSHEQAYSRKKRPRDNAFHALLSSTAEMPCCIEWRASGPNRTKCPQHLTARQMRHEELSWRGRLSDMHRISDDDWLRSGYSIH